MFGKIKQYIYNKTKFGRTRYLNYLYQYDLKQYFDNSLMFSHFCVYQHTILIRTQKCKAATVTKHLQKAKRRKGVFNLYENV